MDVNGTTIAVKRTRNTMKIRLCRDITFNSNPPHGTLKSFTKGAVIEAELIGPEMFKTRWGYVYKGEHSVVEDQNTLRVEIQDQYYTLEEIEANSYTWPDEVNINAVEAVAKAVCAVTPTPLSC
jgi:hypothetical protein